MSTSTECTRSETSISVSWFFRQGGGVPEVFCDARAAPCCWFFLGLGGVPSLPFVGETGVSCFFLRGGGGVLLVFLAGGGVSVGLDCDGKVSRLFRVEGGVLNGLLSALGQAAPFPFLETGGVPDGCGGDLDA